jgi:TonB family protein
VRWIGLTGALLGAVLTAISPALAQDAAEDWDMTVDPSQQLTLATLDFGDNALALRCKAGTLDLLMTGTPVSDAPVRAVRVTVGGLEGERQGWLSQPGAPVLSASEPDRLARLLKPGGELGLRIEPLEEGGRTLRYSLPIPPSASAIDQVLSACGANLTDEWDLRPRPTTPLTWAHLEFPEYPETAAGRNIDLATVRLGCIVAADGHLTECRVLYEAPDGMGFGRAALRAARDSRVRFPEGDTSSVGAVVVYSNRFRAPEN